MSDDARARILANIRDSLGADAPGRDESAVEARLAALKPNLIPARARIGPEAQVDLFVEMAEEVETTVTRVAGADEAPGAVADYLAAHNLPAVAKLAPDPGLDDIPWAERPTLALSRGVAGDEDAVTITGAFAGIAETGTLMLLSGPDHPTTLNILPETHIVVLRREHIVGAYEEGWARLRAEGRGMPRTVGFVTGPSRSADIEQTILIGAHGPRRLHIVLIDGDGDETEA